MEFDHLKGFFYVAKLGSFTEAAGRLYLTQPAISLQVKALEREIGERLFDRIGRSIRLTTSGKILYRHVEELISKLDEIQRVVAEIKSCDRGRLDIGASDTTSMYFLPGLLKSFRTAHGNVELSIRSLLSAEVIRQVSEREIDLGIVTLGEVPDALAAVPLFRQKLVCIAGADHPLSARKLVCPKDLEGLPFVALDKRSLTRRQVESYLRAGGTKAAPFLELSNYEIIKSYVAAGLGVSIVPEAAVESSATGISVMSLFEPPIVQIGIVYRKDREFSNPARVFLAMAEEYFPGQRNPPRRVPQPA